MTEAPDATRSDEWNAGTSHTSPKALPPVARAFQDAIDCATPPAKRGLGRRAAMLMALGARVTRQAIQHWRTGRRVPPAWALDWGATTLEERAASYMHSAALLRAELEKRKS